MAWLSRAAVSAPSLVNVKLGLSNIRWRSYTCGSSHPVGFVQLPSHVWLFVTPWPVALQGSLPRIISRSLPKFMSIELVMLSNRLILCCPLFLLPPVFPSIRVFSNESVFRIRWLKYWCFCFSISPSNEYSRMISFRIDWFDLFAVQGTLKSLLLYHSSKTSIICRSAFFMVQLSHIHDYWKDHILGYTDLCQQSDVFAF